MARRRLLTFVIALDLIGLIGIVVLWPHRVDGYLQGLLLLATLAALGGAQPVRIPTLKTSVSVTDPFVFAALAGFGAGPACLVAGAGVIGATFGKQRHRRPLHVAFNVGNGVASTAAAALTYLLSGGVVSGPVGGQAIPLLAATTVYFLLNTSLVTVAIMMDAGRGFGRTWRATGLWTGVSAYAGLTLAVFLLWALQSIGISGLALGFPPCWLLVAFYRSHKERQEAQQERIDEIQEVNTKLEDMVGDRTRELRSALSHIEKANARLRTTNERLTEANRAKSEFLANVSHELRTPLNAIIGFSELLLDPNLDGMSGNQREYVEDIHGSGEHLLGLINGILDLSKIEAERMELHLERVDLGKALREALSMVRPQASKKQLLLEVRCEGVRAGRLDPGMFRQILVNLLSNAVKFTPDGGRVRLFAERDGADLLVRVDDTGIGIPAEDLDRVFREFYQVDGSYSRSYGGTGLGLALVRRMVELQGGNVSVTSEPGQGSCFACRFPDSLRDEPVEPRAEAPPQDAAPEPEAAVEQELRAEGPPTLPPDSADTEPPSPPVTPVPDPGGQEGTAATEPSILVIEDNPLNRKLARNALRSRGFRVLEAATAEEALGVLRESLPDLILMDLQLPGMDGLELTRRLKDDPRTNQLSVVALSAHARELDEQQARAAGCVGYISKPISLADFPRQVASLLGERDGRESTLSRG